MPRLDIEKAAEYNFAVVKTAWSRERSRGQKGTIMAEKKILTRSGYEKLESELNDLTVNQRKEIAQKIKEAREQGDLSENAEYDAAKEEQRHIEARIAELEAILKNVEIVEEEDMSFDRVNISCLVTVQEKKSKKTTTFHMVGSTEANSMSGKISNESPIGQALMGHKKGETVVVHAPVGEISYKILNIERADH